MTLKFRFKFQIMPALGVRASDASDLPMVGYLLELLCDGSPFGGHHEDEATIPSGVPTSTYPNLGVVIR
jgi:hypothetical protein